MYAWQPDRHCFWCAASRPLDKPEPDSTRSNESVEMSHGFIPDPIRHRDSEARRCGRTLFAYGQVQGSASSVNARSSACVLSGCLRQAGIALQQSRQIAVCSQGQIQGRHIFSVGEASVAPVG